MGIYRIRLKEGDREIEVEGDKKFVLDVVKKFGYGNDGIEKNSSKERNLDRHTAPNKALDSRSLSAAEFVLQYQFKKHTDVTLAFAYFLEKHRGMAKFTAADINGCYYESKLEPSNTSLNILRNQKRGFLMIAKDLKSSKGKNFYTVTQSGLEFIAKWTKSKSKNG